MAGSRPYCRHYTIEEMNTYLVVDEYVIGSFTWSVQKTLKHMIYSKIGLREKRREEQFTLTELVAIWTFLFSETELVYPFQVGRHNIKELPNGNVKLNNYSAQTKHFFIKMFAVIYHWIYQIMKANMIETRTHVSMIQSQDAIDIRFCQRVPIFFLVMEEFVIVTIKNYIHAMTDSTRECCKHIKTRKFLSLSQRTGVGNLQEYVSQCTLQQIKAIKFMIHSSMDYAFPVDASMVVRENNLWITSIIEMTERTIRKMWTVKEYCKRVSTFLSHLLVSKKYIYIYIYLTNFFLSSDAENY